MKRIFYSALIAGVVLASGCSKEEKKQEPTAEEAALAAEEAALDELTALLGEELERESQYAGLADEEMWQNMTEEEAEALLAWAESPEEMLEPVQFAMNSSELTAEQKDSLKYDVELAKQAIEDGKQITFAGHCMPAGDELNNLELSEQRAEAVKQVFVDAGLPEESLHTAAYGASLPAVWSSEGGDAQLEALAPNSRVEMLIA